MANTRKLTTEEQAALDAVAAMPDSEIDTSDMPEVTDWSGAIRGGLYRPVKRFTSLRLDHPVTVLASRRRVSCRQDWRGLSV